MYLYKYVNRFACMWIYVIDMYKYAHAHMRTAQACSSYQYTHEHTYAHNLPCDHDVCMYVCMDVLIFHFLQEMHLSHS